MIRLQASTYELIEEHRNGWNQEAFKERYSDILDKYDYIVGDWGYGQLRLRGFFDNSNRKVPFEHKIATLDEYIQEFCNFGCAYFVLKRAKVTQGGAEFYGALESEEKDLENEGLSDETTVDDQNQRSEGYPKYQRRHERLDRSHGNRQEGKDKTDRTARFDKSARSSRGEQKERVGDRAPRSEQSRRNANQHPNRIQRDKVPTNAANETSRNSNNK